MISLILWALAAIANALMDTLENENFFQSIFHKKEKTLGLRWDLFWYKRESWKHAPKLLGYKFDAWHMSKSVMIFLWIASTLTFTIKGMIFHSNSTVFNVMAEIIIRGLMWNLTFSLFYHKLFRLK